MYPHEWLRFVQIDPFPRQWEVLGLTDSDLRILESAILAAPKSGAVVPGGGGLRKLRFVPPSSRTGKRGSLRVLYAYFAVHGTITLRAGFAKNQRADLTRHDLGVIASQIGRIKALLDRGIIR